MQLWAGLGNPGATYALNRHNVGFMALDAIAELHDFEPPRKRFQGWAIEARLGAEKLLLLKPATFMNESGQAIGEAMRFYKLDPQDVTVFHDELDLEPFRVKVKTGGGTAGHNGLRSTEAHIGPDFRRVRIGIGHPGHKDRVHKYVLSNYAKAEFDPLSDMLGAIAAEARWLAEGDDPRFMNDVAAAGGRKVTSRSLFATRLYEGALDDPDFVAELEDACRQLAEDDRAGRAWSKAHGYRGYTSYASLGDLPLRDPTFGELARRLNTQVAAFAKDCAFDLGGKRLKLDSLWVNILKPGGTHSGHVHPHSVISGTVYVAVPAGAGPLKLEDPRLAMMMAAPPRAEDTPEELRSFVYVAPEKGTILLWESWLRHEVPPGTAKRDRISISFNYRW